MQTRVLSHVQMVPMVVLLKVGEWNDTQAESHALTVVKTTVQSARMRRLK